jgi:hypothetical protein|tara:strand:+ start:909 stop:1370 length:462 start_codon:yes stop_codon:yes gene_type:complete
MRCQGDECNFLTNLPAALQLPFHQASSARSPCSATKSGADGQLLRNQGAACTAAASGTAYAEPQQPGRCPDLPILAQNLLEYSCRRIILGNMSRSCQGETPQVIAQLADNAHRAVDAGLTDHSLFPTPRLRHSPHHSPQWNYSEIQHDNRNNP